MALSFGKRSMIAHSFMGLPECNLLSRSSVSVSVVLPIRIRGATVKYEICDSCLFNQIVRL
jgi:hypothetical protein